MLLREGKWVIGPGVLPLNVVLIRRWIVDVSVVGIVVRGKVFTKCVQLGYRGFSPLVFPSIFRLVTKNYITPEELRLLLE